MIQVLAIIGWLVAFGLAVVICRVQRRLELTEAELRGANYRAAAGWNAWEELKFRRARPERSAALEGYLSFATIEEITRGKP